MLPEIGEDRTGRDVVDTHGRVREHALWVGQVLA